MPVMIDVPVGSKIPQIPIVPRVPGELSALATPESAGGPPHEDSARTPDTENPFDINAGHIIATPVFHERGRSPTRMPLRPICTLPVPPATITYPESRQAPTRPPSRDSFRQSLSRIRYAGDGSRESSVRSYSPAELPTVPRPRSPIHVIAPLPSYLPTVYCPPSPATDRGFVSRGLARSRSRSPPHNYSRRARALSMIISSPSSSSSSSRSRSRSPIIPWGYHPHPRIPPPQKEPALLTYSYGDKLAYVCAGKTYEDAINNAIEAFPALASIPSRTRISLRIRTTLPVGPPLDLGVGVGQGRLVGVTPSAWAQVLGDLKKYELVYVQVEEDEDAPPKYPVQQGGMKDGESERRKGSAVWRWMKGLVCCA